MKEHYRNYTVFHKAGEVLIQLDEKLEKESLLEDKWYEVEVELISSDGTYQRQNVAAVLAKFYPIIPPSPLYNFLLLATDWADDWKEWKDSVEQVKIIQIGQEIVPPSAAHKLQTD